MASKEKVFAVTQLPLRRALLHGGVWEAWGHCLALLPSSPWSGRGLWGAPSQGLSPSVVATSQGARPPGDTPNPAFSVGPRPVLLGERGPGEPPTKAGLHPLTVPSMLCSPTVLCAPPFPPFPPTPLPRSLWL